MNKQIRKQKRTRPIFFLFALIAEIHKTARCILIYSRRNVHAFTHPMQKQFCGFTSRLHNSFAVRPFLVQSSPSSSNFILITLAMLAQALSLSSRSFHSSNKQHSAAHRNAEILQIPRIPAQCLAAAHFFSPWGIK